MSSSVVLLKQDTLTSLNRNIQIYMRGGGGPDLHERGAAFTMPRNAKIMKCLILHSGEAS